MPRHAPETGPHRDTLMTLREIDGFLRAGDVLINLGGVMHCDRIQASF